MRRKELEITDKAEILAIINQCTCCRVGFYDGQEVYIVPLSFGLVADGAQMTLYFHGAKQGRKVTLASQVETVGFEMDCNYKLNEDQAPCDFSVRYHSIIGTGAISIVEDGAEKEQGLQVLMAKHTQKSDWKFSQQMLDATCVFKVEVSKLSCKSHL